MFVCLACDILQPYIHTEYSVIFVTGAYHGHGDEKIWHLTGVRDGQIDEALCVEMKADQFFILWNGNCSSIVF